MAGKCVGWLAGAVVMAAVAGGTQVGFAQSAAPVTASDSQGRILLSNGLVAITLNKQRGMLSSIRANIGGKEVELGNGGTAMMFDFDTEPRAHATIGPGAKVSLVSATPEEAEISLTTEPTNVVHFTTETHYILRRGDPGFYCWIRFVHDANLPAAVLEQTRAVIRPVRGTELFTNYVVDDFRKGPFPWHVIGRPVFDTTWLYAEDNIAHSKYETSMFIGDDLVHGMAGHGVGIWLIQPGRGYVNGGPLHQELTVHQDSPQSPPQNNILLWMLQGNHFGAPVINLKQGQEWSRFYGPCFVYVNDTMPVGDDGGVDTLWQDAKKRAEAEDVKWPYAFVKNADYPLERGTVTGKIHVSTNDSPQGAWVVLAPNDATDFNMSADGYEFWTHADRAGNFTISKVRPGTYKLFVSGANQFDDFTRADVKVDADKKTDLGTLEWKAVTHGRTLWQIGVPDRSDSEFAFGNDTHHFINDTLYLQHFPNDVTYTVGKSQASTDWNFSQWGWYNQRPYWSVLFDGPAGAVKEGTLTISFVAFDYPRGVKVTLNGKELQTIHFQKSGMAAYRAGGQDSLRQTAVIPVDGALFHKGQNELRLEMVGAVKYTPETTMLPNAVGAVMYDALRMEVEP
ncbi:MAG TPA: polysaccharide lyase family protein [Phycisphaerae bacterium]|nr:polysaccharide lyase family protein [Phycisphaerae bacterium]